MTGRARVIALVALSLLTALAAAAEAAGPGSDTLAALLARAYAEGTAPVIVKLAAPSVVTEGELHGDAFRIFLQRQRIADHQDVLLSHLAATVHRLRHRYAASPFLALDASPDALRRLAASPLVESISEDFILVPALVRSGPRVHADLARAAGLTGAGQVVAVVDTGISETHPFFTGRIVEEWCFVSPSECPNHQGTQSGSGAAADVEMHGSHVAGIAAGSGPAFSGMAPQSNIIAIRVFSASGGAFLSDVKAALDRLIVLKSVWPIAAVNLSLGTSAVSSTACDSLDGSLGLKPDIDTLRAAGIATVVAMGNDGSTSSISYPACLSTTVKVGASTNSDAIAFYSNRSAVLEATTLFAPGGSATTADFNICSSLPAGRTSDLGACPDAGGGGTFGFDAGTSMATPHVAGAWAALKQVKPAATVDEILAALRTAATVLVDSATGSTYRRINIRDAIGPLTGLSLSSLVANRSAPQQVGTKITFTANTTGGVAPLQYKWWVFDGSQWTIAQDWSTANTFDWTPMTVNSAYQVGVWVKSGTIPGDLFDSVQSTASVPFAITTSTLAVSLGSSLSPPQAPGTSVDFTATATGGIAPYQYRWWVFDGTTWTIVQDWSTASTFRWTPTTENANYRVGVWVKSATNTSDFFDRVESTQSVAFAIQALPLTLASLTANKTAPQDAGTTITFTATATGGTTPYQYRWWVFDGTTWMIVQNWSTANTFAWTPVVANASYRVGVWIKSATNTSDTFDRVESTQSVAFAIQGASAAATPLTLTGLTADKTAPQPPGTTITFTATATGGTAPYQYRWWVFDGVTWSIVQNWSTSSSFTWIPTAENANYRVGVWIKSATNTTDLFDRVESTQSIPFAIQLPPLTLTSLIADQTAPQPTGTAILFTATASGGTTPYQYRWWVFDGTTWTIVQNWSTASTFTWTPTVANASYRVGVWIKSATNTSDLFDRVESTQSIPFAIGP